MMNDQTWNSSMVSMPTCGPVHVRLVSANRPVQHWEDLHPSTLQHPSTNQWEPCWLTNEGDFAGFVGDSEWTYDK